VAEGERRTTTGARLGATSRRRGRSSRSSLDQLAARSQHSTARAGQRTQSTTAPHPSTLAALSTAPTPAPPPRNDATAANSLDSAANLVARPAAPPAPAAPTCTASCRQTAPLPPASSLLQPVTARSRRGACPSSSRALSPLGGLTVDPPSLARSCTNCRSRKVKCDSGRPCNNCTAQGTVDTCAYRSVVSSSLLVAEAALPLLPEHSLTVASCPQTSTKAGPQGGHLERAPRPLHQPRDRGPAAQGARHRRRQPGLPLQIRVRPSLAPSSRRKSLS